MIGQVMTRQQLAVAVYLHAYQAQNDNMPTHAEIANAFCVVGNAAYESVQRLKKIGVIEATEHTSRYRFARTPAGLGYRAQIKAEHLRQGGAA